MVSLWSAFREAGRGGSPAKLVRASSQLLSDSSHGFEVPRRRSIRQFHLSTQAPFLPARYLGLACCRSRDHTLPFALCSYFARRTAALDVAPQRRDIPLASGTTSGQQCLLRDISPPAVLFCTPVSRTLLLQCHALQIASDVCRPRADDPPAPIPVLRTLRRRPRASHLFHIPRSHPVDSRHAGVPILFPGFSWATSTALVSCKAAAELEPQPARLCRRTQPPRVHQWHRGPLAGRSPTHHPRHARS